MSNYNPAIGDFEGPVIRSYIHLSVGNAVVAVNIQAGTGSVLLSSCPKVMTFQAWTQFLEANRAT